MVPKGGICLHPELIAITRTYKMSPNRVPQLSHKLLRIRWSDILISTFKTGALRIRCAAHNSLWIVNPQCDLVALTPRIGVMLVSARKLDSRGLTFSKGRKHLRFGPVGNVVLDSLGCSASWVLTNAPRDLSVGHFCFPHLGRQSFQQSCRFQITPLSRQSWEPWIGA